MHVGCREILLGCLRALLLLLLAEMCQYRPLVVQHLTCTMSQRRPKLSHMSSLKGYWLPGEGTVCVCSTLHCTVVNLLLVQVLTQSLLLPHMFPLGTHRLPILFVLSLAMEQLVLSPIPSLCTSQTQHLLLTIPSGKDLEEILRWKQNSSPLLPSHLPAPPAHMMSPHDPRPALLLLGLIFPHDP